MKMNALSTLQGFGEKGKEVGFYLSFTEVGIYKEKQESKKTRKQESDQEKKVVFFFLGPFLGRVLVFLFS